MRTQYDPEVDLWMERFARMGLGFTNEQVLAVAVDAHCQDSTADGPLDAYYRQGDEQYDALSLDERDERYGGP
jgi:hypothetical protein